jgi:membrane peptidoglycan carboxypeptidase
LKDSHVLPLRLRLRKKIIRVLICLIAFSIAYQIVVAVWAASATPHVLAVASQKFKPVDLSRIPPHAIDMILQVEDPAFYQHPGIDLTTSGQGFTTITQAVTKMLFLSGQIHLSGMSGSMQDFYIAMWNAASLFDMGRDTMAITFNAEVDKQTQLQLFLSVIYMGEPNQEKLYGVESAASAYFNKTTRQLTDEEWITLAAMMKAPDFYRAHSSDLKERIKRIHRLLSNECAPDGVFDTDFDRCADSGGA